MVTKQKAYLLENIEEYGKLMSFCIKNDICVFRTYWDEREKGNRCYSIDWKEKRCYYSRFDFYAIIEKGKYDIVRPEFTLDVYGNYLLKDKELL